MDEHSIINLRSDTSTLPPREMLETIQSAKLGNDGFKEDPTVNELQEMAAERLGKEAALFVPSGTQGNLVALMCHTTRGKELICEKNSHIIITEVGYSVIAGLVARSVDGEYGVPNYAEVEEAIRSPKSLGPGVLTLENTHNRAGGTIMLPEQTEKISALAHDNRVPVHLDGSRIFNAAVALNVDVKKLTYPVDSVMFCLSKSLCAPAGSILVGTHEFIGGARKVRRMLGGEMRQVGVLAACGIYALQNMVGRLNEDHQNSRTLAESLVKLNGIKLDSARVQTNIVSFDISDTGMESPYFCDELRKLGILVFPMGRFLIRAVTHRDISKHDIYRTITAIEEITSRPLTRTRKSD